MKGFQQQLPTGLKSEAMILRNLSIANVLNREKTMPTVEYLSSSEILYVSGNCAKYEAYEAFKTAYQITSTHFKDSDSLTIVLDIDKINGTGIKSIMSYFYSLQKFHQQGKITHVRWVTPKKEEVEQIIEDISENFQL